MKSKIKGKNGSALLSIIIVAAILVTLGISILGMNLAETKFSVASEKNLQAEYIAKSGADIAAKYMKDHPEEVSASFTGYPTGNGTFDAYVTATDNPNVKKIVSTGYIDGKYSNEVNLIIQRHKSYKGIFTGITSTSTDPLLLYEKYNLYLSLIIEDSPNMDITANVASEEQIILHDTYENDDRFNQIAKTVEFPPVVIPDYSKFKTSITNPITQDYYCDGTLEGDIYFDTTGGDIVVVTEKLDFSSSKTVHITGGGFVHIYVKSTESTSIKCGNEKVNSSDGDNGILILYFLEGTIVDLASNATANTYIYGPGITFNMENPDSKLSGAVVAGIINVKNNPTFTYVPMMSNPDDDWIKTSYEKIAYLK
ncbi:MAG: DUF7305 domain-containing protein [Saccharofermentanales bacterium]